jgi:folate-binding protein YgfZ
LIGPAGQSEKIAAHIDRYTILEDATPVCRDGEFCAVLLAKSAAALAGIEADPDEPIGMSVVSLGGIPTEAYRTRWLGEQSVALLVPAVETESVVQALREFRLVPASDAEFHEARIKAGFPWYGIDLDESNLPQELDRDGVAISFTKGCYLGQETVARLDALGQVQRKLVRWSIQGAIPDPGAILNEGDKAVGRLTSIAALSEDNAIALGFARRSHFDANATASGSNSETASDSGADFTATVL